jgi:uncharacterized membrane protein YeiH
MSVIVRYCVSHNNTLLLHAHPISGCKLYDKLQDEGNIARAYKFVSLVLACTGGGTLVPIFLNSIPVALSTDAYAIAIVASFVLHEYFPILRGVWNVRNNRILGEEHLLGVCRRVL